MEQKRNLILQGTETFSKGALDNVALEKGTVVLDSVAGRYLQYGCYTTPEFAMPAFCNLNVSWNAEVPKKTLVEVQCRVFAAGDWTSWMSFGKWAPDYPRKSGRSGADRSMVFLMGDTVTVATPGGATGVQLQISLSTNDDKLTPAVRLLAAAVRPLEWEKQDGAPVNRMLYLPEYCLSAHDPSFGKSMDLPLTLAALVNRRGEDVLPEELAYTMADGATGACRNAAYAAAATASCGYPCWQVWADLKDLREQIKEGCPAAVEMECRPGEKGLSSVWMGLHGFGYDSAVSADYVLLNDPTADSNETVPRTMALADFKRYFTGRALLLGAKPRGVWGPRPCRVRCELRPAQAEGEYSFECRGAPLPLPDGFAGWTACALHDGVAHATTAHKTFRRLQKSPFGGIVFPPDILDAGGRYSVFAVDETGTMRVAELRLAARAPKPASGDATGFRENGEAGAEETASGGDCTGF